MPIEYPKPPAEADKAAADGVLDVHRAETRARARARSLREIGDGGRRSPRPTPSTTWASPTSRSRACWRTRR